MRPLPLARTGGRHGQVLLIQGQDARSGAGSPETVLSQLKFADAAVRQALLEQIVFTWDGAAELAGGFADGYPEQCLSLAA